MHHYAFAVLTETIVTALAGLFGVIVGALLGLWREHLDRKGKTLSAARLVEDELTETLMRLNHAVAPETHLTKSLAPRFETPAWREMRATLALGLEREQWNAVRRAFAAVSSFRVLIEEETLSASAKDEGRKALDLIAKARQQLQQYAGPPPDE
jgi:hypothetical protein